MMMAQETREKSTRTTRTTLEPNPMWERAPMGPPENAVPACARRKSELEGNQTSLSSANDSRCHNSLGTVKQELQLRYETSAAWAFPGFSLRHHYLQGPRRCAIVAGGAPRMLKLLRINNIAIISELELELGPGLTLLTGETGAGKSILIDALGLILGARATSELIRTGEDRAVVEAVFDSAAGAREVEARGLPVEGREVFLRREVHESGKGKATVNGALVPVGVLRELAPVLAVVHGQHEPQGLLDPDTHVSVLDRHAGLDEEAAALAAPFHRLREVEAELEALRRDRREAERRREMLEYQAAEIDKAHLAPGEEDALRQEKRLQASAGRLAELSGEAFRLLYDDEEAVVSRLGQVYRKVEELAAIDPRLGPHLEARDTVKAHLDELA